MLDSNLAPAAALLDAVPTAPALPLPTCPMHPGSLIRRYRTHGPNGPGVYPQCVPTGDAGPTCSPGPRSPGSRR